MRNGTSNAARNRRKATDTHQYSPDSSKQRQKMRPGCHLCHIDNEEQDGGIRLGDAKATNTTCSQPAPNASLLVTTDFYLLSEADDPRLYPQSRP